jgi:hypothetical protein
MKTKLLVIFLVLLLAGTAAAATIDFTSATFGGANGHASFSASGVTLTAGPSGAVLTWNYWNSFDGIGINYEYMPNQVEGPELLTAIFSVPVYISSVLITNLYYDPYNPPDSGYYPEIGRYELNASGNWIQFSANAGQYPDSTHGELALQVGSSVLVNRISFMAAGVLPNNQNHEFSVAKIEATLVPLPAAVWLLGSGLVGLVALRRRRP